MRVSGVLAVGPCVSGLMAATMTSLLDPKRKGDLSV